MTDVLEGIRLFGFPLISLPGLGELALRLTVDLLAIFIIVRVIFYPRYREKTYFFSYFLVNISVFLLCIMLGRMQMNIGLAFGLFAVFSIIRYRTEGVPIKEMTYLFITIIVAVINALSVSSISYAEILAANAVLISAVYVLERYLLNQGDLVRTVR